jgi:GntR family transcriptional regulator / MocR family aminotransferase
MPRRSDGPILTGIMLDHDAPVPLYRQVYEAFRAAILRRQLSPGARLPSTRTLARDLGISRYTVVEAFLQLLAEGYLEGKAGSGTYVTRTVPEELLRTPRPRGAAPPPPQERRPLSQRSAVQMTLGWHLIYARRAQLPSDLAFQVGMPALDAFPEGLWGQLVARHSR